MSNIINKDSSLEFVNNAWLGLGDTSKLVYKNPLIHRTQAEIENLEKHIISLMKHNADYIAYTAKTLLNIQLLPIQCVILQELWNRTFPMYVASRGFGKATDINEPILTDNGWVKMKNICIGNRVYGRDGQLHKIIGVHPQGKKRVCRITLLDGRTLDCCEDHLWVVKRNDGKELVVDTKKIISKYKYVKNRVYKYRVPNCQPIQLPKQDLLIDPYLMGCLLGDGCLTTLTPKISSNDEFIINQFREKLPDFIITKDTSNNNYTIVDGNKDATVKLSKLGNLYSSKTNNRLTTKLKALQINVDCYHKFIPTIYKNSSIEDRMELVRGLIDTDGSINTDGAIEFTSVCEKLVDDLIDILRSLGITCMKKIDNRVGQIMTLPQGTLCVRKPYFRVYINTSKPIAKLPRKLSRIKTKPTNAENFVSIVKAEYLDKYVEMQCITVDNPDGTYITKDYIVTHNSFMLALYATLQCVLYPGTKIVIVGAGFRQAKVIFEYMESIWHNAPILRDICDNNSGPRRDVDRCTMKINDSWAVAIPMGDGCVVGETFITYNNRFGYINQCGDNSLMCQQQIWDGNCFVRSDEYYYNNIKPIKKIVTKKGLEFNGTYNHKIQVLDKNYKVIWKKLEDISIGDYVLIDKSIRWHHGKFKCTEDQAYALGLMIGDGCWTNKYKLEFITKDHELIHSVRKGTDFKFKYCNDDLHYYEHSIKNRHKWLDFWQMQTCYTLNKVLPSTILSAGRKQMTACLCGLFDSDGTLQVSTAKGGTAISVSFCGISQTLVKQIQYILLHYGIVSTITSRHRNPKHYRVYELLISGQNTVLFGKKIGFRLKRKQNILLNAINSKIRTTEVDNIIPYIKPLMLEIAKKYKQPTDYGMGYSKIVARKEINFDFTQRFLKKYNNINHPNIDIIKNLYNTNIYYDVVTSISDEKPQKTYDLHVPITHQYCANGFFSHNTKIRGLRAHIICADEFGSISPDIYETVVAGFAAVSADPIQNVKEASRRMELAKLGVWTTDQELKYSTKRRNQAIISGTADYAFKNFAKYWKRYHNIINSGGDPNILKEVLGMDTIPDSFDYRDYSIIRIPYELIPEGFMDDKQIIRAKATMHSGIFLLEYSAVFAEDSEGFFKRSLIEKCVGTPENPISLPSGDIWFDVCLHGRPGYSYVIGVDTASESDNFSIVVLEIHDDHVRIVYCWSTNREDFKRRLKSGLADKDDFYGFCVRKIRSLMKAFNVVAIAIDGQGGGIAIEEGLHDSDKMEDGELPIWPVIEDKEKDTDIKSGLHILHICQFVRADWTAEANHGLRKDLETQIVIFPRFDSVTLELANNQDGLRKTAFEKEHPNLTYNLYDTLEDCVMEIEELKNELSTIVMTQTGTGVGARDRWDTPEVKLPNGKKGKLLKDRYSALVMANMISRQYKRADPPPEYNMIGDFAHNYAVTTTMKDVGHPYQGPDWFVQGMEGLLKVN